jgi:hypothetical protein
VNSKSIQAKWYEVSPNEMKIQTSGSALTSCGTNASFFVPNTSNGPMTAMHVLWGSAVFNGGSNNFADQNNQQNTKMSALYCRLLVSTAVGYGFGIINQAQTYSDVPH